MATPVKVGARNDLTALKDARRFAGDATIQVERAITRVGHMREGMGRPDYGPLDRTLGEIALSVSKINVSIEKLWVTRAQAGLTNEEELVERLSIVEAELQSLKETIGQVMA